MFELPSPAALFGSFVFGIIGYAAYRYGKKSGGTRPMLIGVALMLYTFFVDETWLIYAIGAALCLGLYIFREQR